MRKLLCTAAAFLSMLSVHPVAGQGPALTNQDITRLIAVGVSDQTVIAVINQATACQFDLSAGAIENLTALGVSAAIVKAMHRTGAGSRATVESPVAAGGAVSLAAVAKAEEERRAKAGKASRVITEKDVGGGNVPVPTTAVPSAPTRSAEASGSTDTASGSGPTKAQLADLEDTRQRLLAKARFDLEEAESALRRDSDSYRTACPTPQSSLRCRSLNLAITTEWPAKIKKLRDELARLEANAR